MTHEDDPRMPDGWLERQFARERAIRESLASSEVGRDILRLGVAARPPRQGRA